ncbi:hypothetical protein CEXT_123321 [Caerostris extrusa]|uniref:Uncharacterized protein n=1 Tax=Caerostris extrusa TaxID=172846 RepID=A0AAV4W9C1_CAEEX|nr:hypothetical protein CEXT_123321 [Caerostris extrusa]
MVYGPSTISRRPPLITGLGESVALQLTFQDFGFDDGTLHNITCQNLLTLRHLDIIFHHLLGDVFDSAKDKCKARRAGIMKMRLRILGKCGFLRNFSMLLIVFHDRLDERGKKKKK